MEFTLSRVALCVCGIVMLAAVLSPTTAVLDDREECALQGQTDTIADMVDTFYRSQADTMTLQMKDLLPSVDSSVTFCGNLVRMTNGKNVFDSSSEYPVLSDGTYSMNDIVRFVKIEGGVLAEKMN